TSLQRRKVLHRLHRSRKLFAAATMSRKDEDYARRKLRESERRPMQAAHWAMWLIRLRNLRKSCMVTLRLPEMTLPISLLVRFPKTTAPINFWKRNGSNFGNFD